jgi:hypothetical protein
VSFVVNVAGREYIDPVAVVSGRKREGPARLLLLPRFAAAYRDIVPDRMGVRRRRRGRLRRC